MTERNERCPCGSGKKYKHCYLDDDGSCSLLAKEKKRNLLNAHQAKDKEVFAFLNDTINDIGTVFRVDPSSQKACVSQRIQLVAIFTLIDVLASYWYEYLGQTGTPRERFISWFDKYCMSEANEEYGKDWILLTVTGLYSFRSSIVHFFGMSTLGEGYSFIIVPDNFSESNTEKLVADMKGKKHQIVALKPKKLHNLVCQGGILMLQEMAKVIADSHTNETKQWEHVDGIDRVYRKIMSEGAKKIALSDQD